MGIGGIRVKVYGVVDDAVRNLGGAVDSLPPAAGEFALVNDMISQSRADELQIPVAVDGFKFMTETRFELAMEPVHPVEALDDLDSAALGPPEAQQITRAADD